MSKRSRPTTDELLAQKAELEKMLSQASGLMSSLEKFKSRFEQPVADIEAKLIKARESVEAISHHRDDATEQLNAINETEQRASVAAQGVAAFAATVDALGKRLTTKETELKALAEMAAEIKDRVEGLLPGAASAGLASAFKERRESFEKPKLWWAILFLVAIALLMTVAILDPEHFGLPASPGTGWMSYLNGRLPFAVPLVWLALYAGRRHSQALRLEEEYAHKETLSKSFEGYKRQIGELEGDREEKDLTKDFVQMTVTALTVHAGRVYTGGHEDISPMNYVTDALRRRKRGDDELAGSPPA